MNPMKPDVHLACYPIASLGQFHKKLSDRWLEGYFNFEMVSIELETSDLYLFIYARRLTRFSVGVSFIAFIANRSCYPQLTIHDYNTPYDDALCGRTQSILTQIVVHRTCLNDLLGGS